MVESQQVLEWMAEGKAQGLQEGQLRAWRTMLRDLLNDRFGVLPDEIIQRIEAASDRERLRAAARQVLQLSRIDDLQL